MKTCPKHPKYKGKKEPKRECPDCLALYLTFGLRPRGKPIPPTKVIPDRSKYSRKRKVRSLEED